MADGKRLKLRCFIEGVEVPIISAQVNAAPNSPVVASLQLLPMAAGTKLAPRSLVHLFYFDNEDEYNPLLNYRGDSIPGGQENSTWNRLNEEIRQDNPDIETIESDYHNYQYKLIFVGEAVSFSWSKEVQNRALILQCSDLSNYWDYAFQYRSDDLFGPGYRAAFSGGAHNLFTDFLTESSSVVVSIVTRPSTHYPALQGLLGGIIHLCEAVGGSYFYGDTYAGQNIFFSLAELRLGITRLITAYDKDTTAKKLLGAGYDDLFGRSLGNLGEQASIRKCINMLGAAIFHETFGQPCPKYSPGTSGTVSGQERKSIKDVPSARGIYYYLKGMSEGLRQVLDTVQGKSDEATAIAPGNIKAVYSLRTQIVQQLTQVVSSCRRTSVQAQQQKLDFVSKKLQVAETSVSQARVKLSEWKVNEKSARVDQAVSYIRDAISALDTASESNTVVTPKNKQLPARLNQQIFRPDVWFSAPPRCNVLFPDDYFGMSYSRSFLEEPTRLLLKTNDEFFGEDELFDSFYFAPKALGLKTQKSTLQAILDGDIMEHELYTGVLPVFEKMGEFNIFAARSGLTPGGKVPKVGLAQRTANFMYFKYRFAARQMQINARFLPGLAVGFPGLIIDKYIDNQTIEDYNNLVQQLPDQTRPPPDIKLLLGTHFLGNFTSVSHSLNQGQSVTTINVGYAREFDELSEFLGIQSGDLEQEEPTGQLVVRTLDVAAFSEPRLNALGPNNGRIVFIEDVTDSYRAPGGNPEGAPTLPLLVTTDSKVKAKSSVPIGVFQRAQLYGADVAELAGDPDIQMTFRAYRIQETTRKYTTDAVDIPPEEYIRPGWYGDCWHPTNIHKVYQEFFGTGSITEPTQVYDFTGIDKVLSQHTQTDDAIADALAQQAAQEGAAPGLASFTMAKGASIEQAVRYLVLLYSYIKQNNLSIHEFTRAYTSRPIANMVDMFGSQDLQLSSDGEKVIQGIEGYHSRAFGPFANLFGLVTQEIEKVVGVTRGSKQAIKLDTRKAKHDLVLAYTAAVRVGKAFLG